MGGHRDRYMFEKVMGGDEETDEETRESNRGAKRVITIPTHETPTCCLVHGHLSMHK